MDDFSIGTQAVETEDDWDSIDPSVFVDDGIELGENDDAQSGDTQSTQAQDTKADQPETAAEDAAEDGTGEGAEAVKAETKAEGFTLKHLGESREVSREEAVTLAQKGLDYDRIREDRDKLRGELPKLKDIEGFISELAEDAGMTPEKFMENIRTQRLVEREGKAGRAISDTAAREQIQKETAARLQGGKPEEQADGSEDRRQNDFREFVAAYPDLDVKTIPESVWRDYNQGKGSLTAIYAQHKNTDLEGQIKALTEKISALEQNEKNRQRSTGSMQTAGEKKQKSLFASVWDDYDD